MIKNPNKVYRTNKPNKIFAVIFFKFVLMRTPYGVCLIILIVGKGILILFFSNASNIARFTLY